ncbi:MAG: peptidase T, partial [Oscillospiraceae bacterium]|nr:peptidase T [Oscillospiraceae bacterium]
MNVEQKLLQYVAFDTRSNEASETIPSSKGQLTFGAFLVEKMKEIGIEDAAMDEFGYVYGTLPANTDKEVPTIGFLAHMDTSPEMSGEGIKPQIIEEYDGGDIVLNKELDIVMKVADYPFLPNYKGQRLITTDGTTLLGADDKAGIAEIMTAVEELINSDIPHGKVRIAFTPDEEIGRGPHKFDVEGFGADYAYTVDGATLGEIEYENFNASAATVTVNGFNIHPGSAKNKMKNAILMGMEFNSLLPVHEIPACTEGYEGFAHLLNFQGDVEKAVLTYIIRDHDPVKFETKEENFRRAADFINARYGEGTVELSIKQSYRNMREMVEPHIYIVDNAKEAMLQEGVTPKEAPIRGGTD